MTPTANSTDDTPEFEVVEIAPDGDVMLDVTFETSSETLKAARRAAKPRPGQKTPASARPLKPKSRVGFRVSLSVLKQKSKYFDRLLGETRFAEARSVTAAFEQLSLRNINPSEANITDLPAVHIQEDDEGAKLAGQEVIFGDLLRILHDKPPRSTHPTIHQIAAIAILADKFDCKIHVSRNLSTLKFKWPATTTALQRDDRPQPSLSRAAEEVLRQKILVAWLLDQPSKTHAFTRELIIYGSRQWTVSQPEDTSSSPTSTAAWWDLPDDLENELYHRRALVLTTLSSIPAHFLRLYTSKTRQCKLGYDSSASCDSFQLGEMVKFFLAHNLISFDNFAPPTGDTMPPLLSDSFATVDVNSIVATLKQCPGYQIDKHHVNCGLRTRMMPIMAFVQTMLASGAIGVDRRGWVRERERTSWVRSGKENGDGDGKEKVFRFTRGLAGDQRLRFEGAMGAERMARELFGADSWDWTPED